MICFRCKKEINDEENYFEMNEFSNRNKIKSDYVHKTCWNLFLNQLNGASTSLAKSNYLLNVMGNHMKNIGMIPKEEEIEIC